MVHSRSPLQFSESGEELGQVFLCDALTRIFHMHHELVLICIVTDLDCYMPTLRKLYGILNQVYKDLFKAPDVADE